MPGNEETGYRILKLLQINPEISQRDMARELGVSLGKANYCLKALTARGWVKAKNFQNSTNKRAYAYCLTPKGVEEKAKVAVRFLRQKMEEYEALRREIQILTEEIYEQNESEISGISGEGR